MTDRDLDREDEIKSIRETAERMASRLNLRFVINEEKVRSFAAEDDNDTEHTLTHDTYSGPTLIV